MEPRRIHSRPSRTLPSYEDKKPRGPNLRGGYIHPGPPEKEVMLALMIERYQVGCDPLTGRPLLREELSGGY